MTRVFVTLIFILFNINAFGAPLRFYSINETLGVSMLNVSSVCKDDNGFVWAASRNGVLRLTDNSYRFYSLPFETHNAIVVKLVKSKSELVAYTNNGQIFKYNPIKDRFDFLITVNKSYIGLANMVAGQHNDYWISTNSGLYRYRNGELLHLNKGVDVRYLTWYDNNSLLFVSTKGLHIINITTLKTQTIFNYPATNSLEATKLYYDKTRNKLWIGTFAQGLFYYDFKTSTLRPSVIKKFPKQPIYAIEPGIDSTMLIGIDGHGIWKIDYTQDKLLESYIEDVDNPLSLAGNGVYDIFTDKQDGRIWVATVSGGISYGEQSPQRYINIRHQINNNNSLCNNHVNKLLEDSKKNLWVATNNGISCFNPQTGNWRTYYKNKSEEAQVFLSLCEDNNGNMWCGTYASGIYVINRESGREIAHYTSANSDVSDFVFDIYKDSDGDIWTGGVRGDIVCHLSKEKKFRKYFGLVVYKFREISPGKMLVGCANGLVVLDKKTGKSEDYSFSSPCQDVLPAKNGAWFGSNGEGLLWFDYKTKQFNKIKFSATKQISNFVNSILETKGYLYLGTTNGLYRFNPKIDGENTPLDVIQNVTFSSNAACLLSNGYQAWGTNNGIYVINPDLLVPASSKGRIYIQDIIVSGRSIRDNHVFELKTTIDSLTEITLSYNQNNLTMDLVPLDVVRTKARFSWEMEGVDAQSTSLSDYRSLNYTNIPPGKYVLKIKMYDSSISNPIAEREFIIRVTPPFWGTWWFRLAIVLLILAIASFSLYFYINRLKQRHAEDKMRFFTNMAHEIRTAITLIKSPLEELGNADFPTKEKYYLHLATKQTRHLASMVTRLLDFQKSDTGKEQLNLKMTDVVETIKYRMVMFESYARSRNISLVLNANPVSYITATDLLKLQQIIDNLISNAIKYSYPDQSVRITFEGNEKFWMLEVHDDGIGISAQNQRKLFREFYRAENAINSNNVGSGIGLLLVKNHVSLHEGEIHCHSVENEGTTFSIKIPFKKCEQTADDDILTKQPPLFETKISHDEVENKMRLLIVEDNNDLRNFMLTALNTEFEVSVACNGKIAWDIIKTNIPDIIVSDVMMPEMDGFELCRLIKSTYETSHIPVVLLTALVSKTDELHGLGLGADGYLTKPFDMTLLVQRIRTIIQNRRLVRDKALQLVNENSSEASLFANDLNNKFIKKASEVVWENISNSEFDKDEFASAMHVSASLLYKKIKSLTDQSPQEFIRSIRLNHALKLLQSRTLSVTEISEMCGFSSLDYFGKAFKKHFGKSPSEV